MVKVRKKSTIFFEDHLGGFKFEFQKGLTAGGVIRTIIRHLPDLDVEATRVEINKELDARAAK